MTTQQSLTPLQQAVVAIRELKARLEAAQDVQREPVAIVGMALRFPGAADTPEKLWKILRDGIDTVREVPQERWDVEAWFSADPNARNRTYSRHLAAVPSVDLFDASFFGIPPEEAKWLDPQHRLLLECSWHALEDAALSAQELVGSRTGVFVGMMGTEEYARRGDEIGPYAATGSAVSTAAGRISYTLGLRGPSVGIDTACSSSLVALNLACQSLRAKETNLALVGGVSLCLTPAMMVGLGKRKALSAQGRCRTFDADADGYVLGEGCAVVVLKRLSDALRSGDRIAAVVRGVAVNQNGNGSLGLTAPNGPAQQDVIRAALEQANLDPLDVDYAEVFGTATTIGDEIEARALNAVYGEQRPLERPLWVGSIKTNVGHQAAASGLASLLKVVLSFSHQQIPPHLHVEHPNPEIPWGKMPLRIATSARPWLRGERPRRAAISSFALSGTNAHAVLEEAPVRTGGPPAEQRGVHLLTLSGKSERAVRQLAGQYVEFLRAPDAPALADICHTAATGRAHLQWRVGVVGENREQMAESLAAYLSGNESERWNAGANKSTKIAFVFPDAGGTVDRWARDVHASSAVFRHALAEGDAVVTARTGLSVASMLAQPSAETTSVVSAERSGGTLERALMCLVVQLALYRWWQELGIEPRVVTGRGVGELAAAVAVSAMSLDQAVALIVDAAAGGGRLPRPAREGSTGAIKLIEMSRACLEDEGVDSVVEFPGTACDWLGPDGARPAASICRVACERGGEAGFVGLLCAAGLLYTRGANLKWAALTEPFARGRVSVPLYPFERRRHWLDATPLEPPAQLPSKPELASTCRVPGSAAAIETELCAICAELLGRDRVSPDDDFFETGGQSIVAMQVIARIEQEFGVEVPVRALFECRSPAELARRVVQQLEDRSSAAGPVLEPAPRRVMPADSPEHWQPGTTIMPLSLAQERLWVLEQLYPGSAAYTLLGAIRMRGSLDLAALERALDDVVRRHEPLRTTFAEVDGQPAQIIAPHRGFSLTRIELMDLPGAERESAALATALQPDQLVFDIERGPLFRASVTKTAEDCHVLALVLHHLVADGWSLGVLTKEVALLYQTFRAGRPSPLEPPHVQYADFAAWQRHWFDNRGFDRELQYWRRKLDGAPTDWDLPMSKPRPQVLSTRGAHLVRNLPRELSRRLKLFSQEQGATLFMTLMAAFQLLLARYSGRTDILTGTAVANRGQRDIEELIGFFVNTLVIRTDLSGQPTFLELVARVRDNTIEALAHQNLPFVRLVNELRPERDLGRAAIVQVMFVLQNAPRPVTHLEGLQLEPLDVHTGTSKFDFELQVTDSEAGLVTWLEYSTDLFEREMMDQFLVNYENLLESLVDRPDVDVYAVPLVGPAEWDDLVRRRSLESTYAWPERPVHAWIEDYAREHPQAPAVVCETESLSYGELMERSGALVAALRDEGVRPGDHVGLQLERSVELVIGMLAILRAGAAYVPLDSRLPVERLGFFLADAGVRVLLCRRTEANAFADMNIRIVDVDAAQHHEQPEGPGWQACDIDRPAYIIYTSGTTGQPNGVVINHRQLVNYVQAIQTRLELPAGSTYATVSTIAADLGNTAIFPALCSGGCLHVISEERVLDADGFAAYCGANAIDCLKIVPSHLAALMTTARPERVLPRKCLVLGGQLLQWDLVERIQALAPGLRVLNHYGPTEGTIGSTTFECGAGASLRNSTATVPIGRPLPNVRTYILDEHGAPVPLGVVGELYLAGSQVAEGYWNRPAVTGARFLPNHLEPSAGKLYRTGDRVKSLPDGNIVFLGRVDDQVKIRGYRVEPGEVQGALAEHETVAEAFVLVEPAAGESSQAAAEPKLVAYVVPEQGLACDGGVLREHLAARMPSYMVPHAIVPLDSLPLTANGKVDRRALPAPSAQHCPGQAAYVPPQGKMAERLAGLWCELIGVERVGMHDNIFDLGGNSLLLIAARTRLQAELGREIPVVELFRRPTIASLAEYLATQETLPPPEPVVEHRVEKRLARLERLRARAREDRAPPQGRNYVPKDNDE